MKQWTGLGVLAVGTAVGLAFTPLGPLKAWQVTALGYDLPGDIGGPMTPTEAYRWNVPTIYYAFDRSFSRYFGNNGIAAVQSAVALINGLPASSRITTDGSRLFINGQSVPFDTRRINSAAQNAACPVLDVKSRALQMLVEQMGLAEPERYVWSLRSRDVTTVGSVSITNYAVVKLNYDPITLQTSSRVNNTLYGYTIFDPIPPQNYADAFEIRAESFSLGRSVAGTFLGPGEFFTGLTHDDVGGLRFLFSGRNFVNEGVLGNVGLNARQGNPRNSPWIPVGVITNFVGNTNIFFPGIPGGATNLTNFVTQALRPGLEKVTFVRANFDSLLGINFNVVTNFYTDRFISNGIPMMQPLQRVIQQPDILFVSEDLGLAANLVPVISARSSTANWQNNAALNGTATGAGGPGVITPTVRLSFSDQLPYFIQSTPLPVFLDDTTSGLFSSGCWGSFDGTTNAPIIYPAYLNLTFQDLNTP